MIQTDEERIAQKDSYIDFLESLIADHGRKIDNLIERIESKEFGPYIEKDVIIGVLDAVRGEF